MTDIKIETNYVQSCKPLKIAFRKIYSYGVMELDFSE
jgi:hypothetical protein